MKPRTLSLLALLLTLLGSHFSAPLFAEEQFTAQVKEYPYQIPNTTVIGAPTEYAVRKSDNLLDIARRFGLGFNELGLLYPRTDAWLPPPNKYITIPSFWVLPPTQHQQLVINVPELRLYFFNKATSTVQTYPIGIGDEGVETPLGVFHITEKRANPAWYIPASLQAKYGMAVMPPGPDNPLGQFVMKFSAGAYGIHGTHMPWGVGRLVSHGCIRCYPEHIRILFPQVDPRATLEIIYQPLKIGQLNGEIFVEAHPDVYRKLPDYQRYAMETLKQYPLANQVDMRRFQLAITLQNGVPTNVTRFSSTTGQQDRLSLPLK